MIEHPPRLVTHSATVPRQIIARLDRVTYRHYGRTAPALTNVSVNIRRGSFTLLVGPSGSGKSMLCMMLNGIIPHILGGKMEGDIAIDGHDIMGSKVQELAHSVGMLFQDPEWMFATLQVEDEVAFGPENLRRPPPEIAERPRLCLDRAWAMMLTGQIDEVEPDLERVETWIARTGPGEEVQYWRGSIAAMRCYLYTRTGDAARGLELGRQALEILPGSLSSLHSVVYLTMGGAYTYMGESASAMECLQEAARLGIAGGNVHSAVTAISAMANLLMVQGKLHVSQEMYLQALPLAARPDGQMLPIAARLYAGLSRLSYEWNKWAPLPIPSKKIANLVIVILWLLK